MKIRLAYRVDLPEILTPQKIVEPAILQLQEVHLQTGVNGAKEKQTCLLQFTHFMCLNVQVSLYKLCNVFLDPVETENMEEVRKDG